MKPLDIAFIIGMITQITTLADFLVRPYQQKGIQAFFETITLQLEDIHPLQWFTRMKDSKTRTLLFTFSVLLFTIAISVQWIFMTFPKKGETILPAVIIGVLGTVLFVGPTLIVMRKYSQTLLAWMFGDGRFTTFLARYLSLVFGFAAVNAICTVPMALLLDNEAYKHSWQLTIAIVVASIYSLLAIVTGSMGIWWSICVMGYIIILFKVTLFVCEIAVRFLRAFCWRVTEYNKGAWAAITLLLTFAVGVAALMSHVNTR